MYNTCVYKQSCTHTNDYPLCIVPSILHFDVNVIIFMIRMLYTQHPWVNLHCVVMMVYPRITESLVMRIHVYVKITEMNPLRCKIAYTHPKAMGRDVS